MAEKKKLEDLWRTEWRVSENYHKWFTEMQWHVPGGFSLVVQGSRRPELQLKPRNDRNHHRPPWILNPWRWLCICWEAEQYGAFIRDKLRDALASLRFHTGTCPSKAPFCFQMSDRVALQLLLSTLFNPCIMYRISGIPSRPEAFPFVSHRQLAHFIYFHTFHTLPVLSGWELFSIHMTKF